MGEQPGVGIDHAFGVERFEHALEPLAEGMQAHVGQKALDQAAVAFGDAFEIGQQRVELLDDVGLAAEHGDRQVAKAGVLGEHGQQRLDHARAETVADHHAVDVAGVERARRALDAECADQADALADGDRETRIGAAAAGDQHGRFLERIAGRHGGNLLAARGERFRPAQNRAVQRADARCGGEPACDRCRRRARRHGQRVRHEARAVVAQAGDDRRERAAAAFQFIGERLRMLTGAFAVAAGFGEHHTCRFDRSDRRGGIGPAGFDDREGSGRAQGVDDVRRRAVGNDEKRTLQRHGGIRIRG